MIHPLLQLLPRLKKRQLLRFDLHPLSRFRIPPDVRPVILHKKRTESPDLHPVPFGKLLGHSIKKDIHNGGSLWFGQIGSVAKCLDQIELVHAFGAPVIWLAWRETEGLTGSVNQGCEFCQEISGLIRN